MKTKKDRIEKFNLKGSEKWIAVPEKLFFNNSLSANAKLLLAWSISNSAEWEFNLNYFAKKIGWSYSTARRVLDELKKNGYIISQKKSLGRGNGFEYNYIISYQNQGSLGELKNEHSINTQQNQASKQVNSIESQQNQGSLGELKIVDTKMSSNTILTNNYKSDSGSDNSSSNRENFLVGTTETESEFELNKKLIEKEIEFENQINALREAENKKTIDNTIQPKELNQSNKTKQKKDYFFQVGERPGLNKINEYINQKGYNQSAAENIYKKLSDSNFKDAAGNQIRYIQSWIDKELNNYTPSINGTEIEQLTIEMADIYTSSLPEEQHCYYHTNRVKLKEAVQLGIEVLGQVKTRKAVVNAINAAKQKGIVISPSSFFKTFKNEMEKAGTTYTTTTTKELTAV